MTPCSKAGVSKLLCLFLAVCVLGVGGQRRDTRLGQAPSPGPLSPEVCHSELNAPIEGSRFSSLWVNLNPRGFKPLDQMPSAPAGLVALCPGVLAHGRFRGDRGGDAAVCPSARRGTRMSKGARGWMDG